MDKITTQQVKQAIEQYFGNKWLFLVLATGGWSTVHGMKVKDYFHVIINYKEIRVYPIEVKPPSKSNLQAIRVAIWDYSDNANHDDMYLFSEKQFMDLPLLLDKFFHNETYTTQ